MSMLVAVSLVVAFLLIVTIFIYSSPQFGGKHTEERKISYQKASNFKKGKFHNISKTDMKMSFATFLSVLRDYIAGVSNSKPPKPLPIKIHHVIQNLEPPNFTQITWLGHSAVLLEINGFTILLDPMLGEVPAPHPWLGKKRFSKKLPIDINELKKIDVVLISHDHYDHLDYESIKKIKNVVNHFLVPVGVGTHLEAWGIHPTKISEMIWWEQTEFEDITFILTPARHFSGRGIADRFATLWGSWVIKSGNQSIFFSGDSGYDTHFEAIGKKYGPFDLAMIECGQYDVRWNEIHMFPEQTVEAGKDLDAKLIMPIHWGAFVLSLHSWDDPIKRFVKRATEGGMSITTPKIGETFQLDSQQYPNQKWWKSI